MLSFKNFFFSILKNKKTSKTAEDNNSDTNNYALKSAPLDVIIEECGPYLKELSKNMNKKLYTSIQELTDKNIKYNGKTYKLNKNLTYATNIKLSDFFKRHLGFKVNTFGVQCFKDAEYAASYIGNPGIILPCGDYTLYSNKNVKDMYMQIFAWKNIPLASKNNGPLSPKKILQNTKGKDGIKLIEHKIANYIIDTMNKFLFPYLIFEDEGSIKRLLRLKSPFFYLRNNKFIYEFFEEEEKISSAEAYDVYFKYVIYNLKEKIYSLLKGMKKINLSEVSDSEVFIKCNNFYLVSENTLNKILKSYMNQ